MDRTEPHTAPIRGGDRTGRGRFSPATLGATATACLVAALVLGGIGGPAGASGTASSTPATGAGASLTLLAPPAVAEPTDPFAVRLGVPAAGRTGLSLVVTVYEAVHDTTHFDDTLGGSPVGSVVAGPFAVPLASLPPDGADPQSGVDLVTPVTAAGTTSPGTGPFTVDLHCALGSCGGVYPVRIALTDSTTDHVLAHLLTYLVYSDPGPATERLRFALVVPLTLASSAAGSAVPASALARWTALVDALGGPRATVPVTLAPSPAAVAALAGDPRTRARSALDALASLVGSPGRETLCLPFVPVDASALVGTGLVSELGHQIERGAQVLQGLPGLRAGGCTAGVWLSGNALDQASLGALDFLGYPDVVVPPGSVSGPAPSITPTRRFTLDDAPHTGDALLSDADLADRLKASSRTDPALIADQILAELELYFYEAQNTASPRGVVAVPPPSWSAAPTVVADVLAALEDNPMVEPVTLASMFSGGADGIPVGGVVGGFVEPSSRRSIAGDAGTGLPVRGLRAARRRWTGLSSALAASSAGSTVATQLDDLLLDAESDRLSPAGQRGALARYDQAFARSTQLLSITSRQVRLTARTGDVPITVLKSAPYPVEAVLTVTSDKITFPPGATQPTNAQCHRAVVTTSASRSTVSSLCTFVRGTNQIYVDMRSRVSGDFRISVSLVSPAAALVLVDGQLTVRSMSTSVVAVVLSAASGAVLLGWWGRTLWRNRRTRRGAHLRVGGRS